MRFMISLLVIAVVSSCSSHPATTAPPQMSPTPPVATAASAIEAKAAFDSPEALTKMLERRWPVAAIQVYCIPEKRHDNRYQNLVAFGVVWHGILHRDVATGFDEIAWYATTRNGRGDKFSLGASRGKDFWLLEIGSEASVQSATNFSPDPSEPGFVGHK